MFNASLFGGAYFIIMKRIETLKPNQIFVFGSNANGHHLGGAARQACDFFGAIWGQAEVMQGQSYGIITLDEKFEKVPLEYIGKQLRVLNMQAKEMPDKEFLLTLIGCGIAGFSIDEIRSESIKIKWNDNVVVPDEFK